MQEVRPIFNKIYMATTLSRRPITITMNWANYMTIMEFKFPLLIEIGKQNGLRTETHQ